MGRHEAVETRNSPIIDLVTLWLGGIVTVVGALAGIAQLTDLHQAIGLIFTCISVGGGALLMYLRNEAQRETVPSADAVEVDRGDGVVVAGPANDRVEAGQPIREIGVS